MREVSASVNKELILYSELNLEVISVARSTGISETELPSTAADDTMAFTWRLFSNNMGGSFKPSMLVDLLSGRPMEIESILGEVVRHGWENNVPIPRYVYNVIKWSCNLLTRHVNSLETAYAALRLLQSNMLAAQSPSN